MKIKLYLTIAYLSIFIFFEATRSFWDSRIDNPLYLLLAYFIVLAPVLPWMWKMAEARTEYDENERRKEKLRQQRIDELLGIE